MDSKRRNFLRGILATAGVATADAATSSRAYAQHVHTSPPPPPRTESTPSAPETSAMPAARTSTPQGRAGMVSIEAPDLPKMPWRVENGVKVFNISVDHVRTEFLPGRPVDAWGFNGSMPGPTIEVNEGDHVRFVVTNRLPEPFSMHWHGLEIPIEMDGMPGISQELIQPGGTFTYEFTLRQNGTFFYHSHMPMQQMTGLIGLFIIHPRMPFAPRIDRDFGLILQEWAILPSNTIPNTLAMEFNWLTINGKAGPATTPMLVKLGERVRIRMVNLGMDHHPIHLHGNTFYVTGTEAGRIHTTAREPGNTVLVGVAQARDIEFDANNIGDWMLHCHMPHHNMNQMSSMVGPMMMSHASGTRPGEMNPGMGIVEGAPLSERSGPAFGRSLGVGAESERAAPNMPMNVLQQPTFVQGPRAEPNAGMFPGYPQDMHMVMDDMVAKPETYGLRPGWSGGMMGMMTLVRVLTPELFDKIQDLKRQQTGKAGA
jgi:FtsP/CotA-like multicopper oxidase with cupredoxin domain